MDDTTAIKIETKAGPIDVQPFKEEQFAAFGMLSGADNATTMKILRALLIYSLGETRASDFMVSMALGQWTLSDLTDLLILIAKKSAPEDAATDAG